MKKGTKREQIQIDMFSTRLIIIRLNDKYMSKEIEKNIMMR